MAIERNRRTFRDEITQDLKMRILASEWEPGEALPSNRQLAEEYSTSSLTVREAVASLAAAGFLESRHGSGTYVLDISPEDPRIAWLLSGSEDEEYAELIEARQILESAVLALAVERRTDADLALLRDAMGEMLAARSDADRFLIADFEFHRLIAESCHNRVLLRAMTAMRGPLRRLMGERATSELQEIGDLDVPIADHALMLQALEERSVELADQALGRMITRNRHHLGQD